MLDISMYVNTAMSLLLPDSVSFYYFDKWWVIVEHLLLYSFKCLSYSIVPLRVICCSCDITHGYPLT